MGRVRPFLVLTVISALAGCAALDDLGTAEVPDLRPAIQPEPRPARSDDSFAQERFYRQVETNLLTQGLLRSDGGGPDVPFTDEMLARNFMALAFSEEFADTGGIVQASGRPSTLHRWEVPITLEPVFGATIPKDAATRDRDVVTAYAARLSRISAHPISVVESGGNFTLFVLHDQDMVTIGPRLRARMPEISDSEIAFVESLPLETYCVVFTSDPANDGRIARAIAIVRAELPPALRTSCYHEELAQGLGLANDSDFARPSIFKDDDEFGRLTDHDEALLSILYHPRLTPGMTEDTAAPIVLSIARSLTAPAS